MLYENTNKWFCHPINQLSSINFVYNYISFISMSQQSSFIRGLEASRKLGSQLDLEQHIQQIQKSKLQRELESLNRSRRQFVDNQIKQSEVTYEQKLKEDQQISEEHLARKKRADAEKAKVAQKDFQRQRQRLILERNKHDDFDRRHRQVEKAILDLKAKSRYASEDQDRVIRDLNLRKKNILQLIQQSKQRQLYHYDQAKKVSSF